MTPASGPGARVARAMCRVALGVLLVGPVAADAQEESIAGWLAMVTSPYGALVPGVTPAMLGTAQEAAAFGGDLEFRYGRLAREGTTLTSIGIGTRVGNFGITGAWQHCNDCDSRSMGGVDYDFIIRRLRREDLPRTLMFTLGARPGIGLGIISGGGEPVYALAATFEMPVSVSIPVGAQLDLVPHLEPGFGSGMMVQGGERDSRFHGSIAAGVTLMNIRPGVGLNVGWRRIMLRDAPGTWGVGLTFRRGGGSPELERRLGESARRGRNGR